MAETVAETVPTWDDYIAACRRIATRALQRHAVSRSGKVQEPATDEQLAADRADRAIIVAFRAGRLVGFASERDRRRTG